jgi:hypothetical protein
LCVEKNIGTLEGRFNLRLKNYIMRSIMIFTYHEVLLGLEIKQVEISGTCSTHGKEEK